MVVTYYIIFFRTRADRHNGILMSLLLLVSETINTQFEILEHSERDSEKILGRNKDSEVQKHVSYIEQRLDTVRDMKYEVLEMMIDSNV